jgi:hypothetical protein
VARKATRFFVSFVSFVVKRSASFTTKRTKSTKNGQSQPLLDLLVEAAGLHVGPDLHTKHRANSVEQRANSVVTL